MTNSHPPTALGRDLVLSDEDLAEIGAKRVSLRVPPCRRCEWAGCRCDYRAVHEAWLQAASAAIRDRKILLAEVRRQRTALRQVRAAIEGRTSVNVSVILSALGEQE